MGNLAETSKRGEATNDVRTPEPLYYCIMDLGLTGGIDELKEYIKISQLL
jgi:hypothetical protein